MSKPILLLIEEVFLEILQPVYLMVAVTCLGRDGLFRGLSFTEQADCIVGLESTPQGSILRWQPQAAFLR